MRKSALSDPREQELSCSVELRESLNEAAREDLPNVNDKQARHMKSRVIFIVFIRILFKCLEEDDVDYSVRLKAKMIIRNCTKRNRLGFAGYEDLMKSIEDSLGGLDGITLAWRRAEMFLERYSCRNSCRHPKQVSPSCSSGNLSVR